MYNEKSATFNELFSPIEMLLNENPHARKCETLTDKDWVAMGIKRVLGENNSGRSFLQGQVVGGHHPVWTSHYFDTLKSQRRLDHLTYLNRSLLLI